MAYPSIAIDFSQVPSPCYVLEMARLRQNLEILDRVQKEAGVKIICALKGFSFWSSFPLVRQYLPGCTASSLNEARLASEEFGGEVHVYAPAYADDEIHEVLFLADHISFNSISQLQRFRSAIATRREKSDLGPLSVGLRVNPEYSEVSTDLYNPCAPFSRLGVVRSEFDPQVMPQLDGLHFHALCEQNVNALEGVLANFEKLFGEFIPQLKWVNFGGGHHITRSDYDVERLIQVLRDFQQRYPGVQVILEPGEAVGWQTGELVATVLDLVRNKKEIAILDISISAHLPDCLEMPYRPEVIGAALPGEKPHNYTLAGGTCLAGDVLGDFSFDKPLTVGDKIVFLDMIHYTMVKTTFFNGVKHPSIAIWHENQSLEVVRSFTYEQFKDKLS
ncbi:MAG: carboxynorspermidine decarboxylase [Fibrobacter sp.]|nr:carboxynorspermidine decarboxylase [Fibrobacter sp.]